MTGARTLAVGLRLGAALASLELTSCHADWGLDAIDHMKTPPDPPLVCGASVPGNGNIEARAGCSYAAGAAAEESLGVPNDLETEIPIAHVLVLMRENRSFDHLLGRLHDEGQPDTEAIPASYVNLDAAGVAVAPFPATTTCVAHDPAHQAVAMRTAVDGGQMDGFVKNAAATTPTDGHFVMSDYGSADLPFYYWLAKTYALSDRHFASMQSGTFGNRGFLLFGTNAGVVDTGISYADPATNSIFRLLMNAGYTWGAYTDGSPLSGALNWSNDDPGVHPLRAVLDALDRGTLPNVAFVDGIDSVDDDHATADLQLGEAWLKQIYDHAVRSPQWRRLVMIWTYDECGAFADHVSPPRGCSPGDSKSWPFDDFGPRVPLVAISPWAKPHYVSHVAHDHTAITRFIEAVFGLPALTARDANSDALFDLFDFSCGRDLTPPAGAPDPGTGGCVR